MFSKNVIYSLLIGLVLFLAPNKSYGEDPITKAAMIEACVASGISQDVCRNLIKQIRGPGCNGINGLFNHCMRKHGGGKGGCSKQMIELIGILKNTFCLGNQP